MIEEEESGAEPGRKHTRKEAEAVDLDAGEDLTPEGEEEQGLLDEEAEALDEDVPYSESGGRFEEEEAATARGRADAVGGIPAGRRKRNGGKKAGGDVGPIAVDEEEDREERAVLPRSRNNPPPRKRSTRKRRVRPKTGRAPGARRRGAARPAR